MKDEFMLCNECKVVLQKIPGQVSSVTGDKGFVVLEAGVVDASKEKHVPSVTVDGQNVIVQVGSVLHPMEEKHYILWIMLRTDKGFMYRLLKPGENPNATFTMQKDEKPLCVYEMCNIHGLWKKEL